MFVDFEKAFDNVLRKALWFKLLSHDICGKMFNIIFNMYSHIKSRIVYNNETSTLRQGENMSAFLFSMYLNDLHDFLNESDVQGLPTITTC